MFCTIWFLSCYHNLAILLSDSLTCYMRFAIQYFLYETWYLRLAILTCSKICKMKLAISCKKIVIFCDYSATRNFFIVLSVWLCVLSTSQITPCQLFRHQMASTRAAFLNLLAFSKPKALDWADLVTARMEIILHFFGLKRLFIMMKIKPKQLAWALTFNANIVF